MIDLHLPRAHVNQSKVITESTRYNVLDCGRRWGKTELGMNRIVIPALNGKPCGWFGPAYKYTSPVWRELEQRLAPVIKRTSQQDHRMELITGGSIEIWSLDSSDAGRSRAYARVVIDEAAMVPDLKSAWQESIRPTLTDYRGDAWFLSTPKGIANYFHSLYQYGQDKNRVEWTSWQMPTITNPHIPPDEIEAARGELTDLAYAQEYQAQFVSWEGAVFRRITDAVYTPEENPHNAVLIGCDWGRTTDYTVFMAVSADGRVVASDRFRGIEYSVQRDRLRTFWQRVSQGRAWILAETNSMGGPVVEQLLRDNMPVVAFATTNASKSAAVEALALAFERLTIKIPNDPVLIGELQAYESVKLPSGMTRYQAPEGLHDDCVMALAIAWSGLEAARSTAPDRIWADPVSGRHSIAPPGGVQISPV